MTNLLLTFIILNICNVILQTVKSLCTVNCGKLMASLVNAVAYGVYTVVIIYTVCDLPLLTKSVVVAVCNLIGVYIVKLIEEKTRKTKLWKIELTIKPQYKDKMESLLKELDIPYNWVDLTKYYVFNIYSSTQKQSAVVKTIANECKAKYFVTESKTL